ncbi:MAG: CRTAC1 family protein [Acidobacteriota bacterium]|nr:CRTAC1 family protein [Acidobacteriota bacterium]
MSLVLLPAAAPFSDATAEWGLSFHHFNGMSGRLYYPEVVGSGGALFDYDGDGDLDLYLVQGAMLGPGLTLDDAIVPPREPLPLRDRLFRNDLTDGVAQFVDVTEASGIEAVGYGIGVATGDYDSDGHIDLYVTNFGANQLWRNLGEGRFENATARAGVGDARFSSSASFVDLDADGWLDLVVANYLTYSYGAHKTCLNERGVHDYCLPKAYGPAADRLYRNLGDGSFADVSARAGLTQEPGNGLGVSTADFDGDGLVDFYIANDLTPNQLWINQGDGRFRNQGLASGSSLNSEGRAEASMGVDAADFDADGDVDIFMTHFSRETNTMYVNDGRGFFEDSTEMAGLATPSWSYTSFGTGFVDYDLDGWLDLLVVNGGVTFPPGSDRQADPYPLDENNQLFRSNGGREFYVVTAVAGPAFAVSGVSRGAVFGDIDNDGDTDVVVTNNSGPVQALRNEADTSRPWIGLRLRLQAGGRDAHGATVFAELEGPAAATRIVHTDGSYASARDPRVVIALGEAAKKKVSVVVRWPDGRRERFSDIQVGSYHELVAGAGTRIEDP